MNTLNKLLDKAIKRCSPSSGEGLGLRLGVSRSAVSKWRNGGIITEEHLTALVEIAGESPAVAVQVLAEQARTHAGRAVWGSLLRQLGAAAVIGAAALLPMRADASVNATTNMHYAKWRALARRLLGRANEPTPLLA